MNLKIINNNLIFRNYQALPTALIAIYCGVVGMHTSIKTILIILERHIN